MERKTENDLLNLPKVCAIIQYWIGNAMGGLGEELCVQQCAWNNGKKGTATWSKQSTKMQRDCQQKAMKLICEENVEYA